jgi:hypothetical protein
VRRGWRRAARDRARRIDRLDDAVIEACFEGARVLGPGSALPGSRPGRAARQGQAERGAGRAARCMDHDGDVASGGTPCRACRRHLESGAAGACRLAHDQDTLPLRRRPHEHMTASAPLAVVRLMKNSSVPSARARCSRRADGDPQHGDVARAPMALELGQKDQVVPLASLLPSSGPSRTAGRRAWTHGARRYATRDRPPATGPAARSRRRRPSATARVDRAGAARWSAAP